MKHERNIYNFFDCAYSWLVKNRGSYIKAVRCSNRYCKRGNSCALYIRREMGADIDGACGQLRKSFIDKSNEQP